VTQLHRSGSMVPREIAPAAVVAATCAALAILAVVVPFGGALSLLATVPMGLLAYRYRLRVVVAAMIAGALVAFVVAGVSGFMVVFICAYIGAIAGIVKRKGRGLPTVVTASTLAGVLIGLLIVGALLVASRVRMLMFDAITANVHGSVAILERVPGFEQSAARVQTAFEVLLAHWPFLIVGYAVFAVVSVTLVGYWALSQVLYRLQGIPDVHKLDVPASDLTDQPDAPVPVTLHDVRFRYPEAGHDALAPVSMRIDRGEHVAVVGANGSGKTTLMLILAGREPSSGTVVRPGAVGLGRPGGTALVLQHPESQVLGTRVADDVVWGLPPGQAVDVEHLLGEVGLAGMGERDTGGLSGGELQRLAIAAALARDPALLIADEVTSMVDQEGREALRDVLTGLTDHRQMALVQITHYNDEAETADRTISLSETHDNAAMVQTAQAPAATAHHHPRGGAPVLQLEHVSHEYGIDTPWAKSALHDISLTVNEGDGLLVHGGNGSGKSTLAWIMAGLTVPTYGRALIGGEPAHQRVGEVAVAFQAARLQLMRPRVDLEVAAAGGFSYYDHRRVVAALAAVGLDASLALRRIDQLSGGQMRRVVLAGLLARNPRALILDEPLAGLDAASQRGLLALLTDLRRNAGLTVVVISHDFVGLEELCPRILHLDDGRVQSAAPTGGLQ
jgi:energy-coupling factor transport system ATP-binding protein